MFTIVELDMIANAADFASTSYAVKGLVELKNRHRELFRAMSTAEAGQKFTEDQLRNAIYALSRIVTFYGEKENHRAAANNTKLMFKIVRSLDV